jgi:hypothetical protein
VCELAMVLWLAITDQPILAVGVSRNLTSDVVAAFEVNSGVMGSPPPLPRIPSA